MKVETHIKEYERTKKNASKETKINEKPGLHKKNLQHGLEG